MLAVEEEQEYMVGPYRVLIRVRPDNPHFRRYVVMRGDRFVGNSFSRPSLDDALWLERQAPGGTLYASVSTLPKPYKVLRGKPRK